LTYALGTGVLTVASGKTIALATTPHYTLTLTATPGGTVSSATGVATLTVDVKSSCSSGAVKFTVGLGLFFVALVSFLFI